MPLDTSEANRVALLELSVGQAIVDGLFSYEATSRARAQQQGGRHTPCIPNLSAGSQLMTPAHDGPRRPRGFAEPPLPKPRAEIPSEQKNRPVSKVLNKLSVVGRLTGKLSDVRNDIREKAHDLKARLDIPHDCGYRDGMEAVRGLGEKVQCAARSVYAGAHIRAYRDLPLLCILPGRTR